MKFRSITALLAVIFFILTISCSTTKKAAKRAEKDRKQRMELAKLARELFPCDTSTVYITKTDTAFVYTSDTTRVGDTVKIYATKTVTNSVEKKVKVLDIAALQSARDSAKQAEYMFSQAATECEKQRNDYDKELRQRDEKILKMTAENASNRQWKTAGISLIIFIALAAGFAIVKRLKLFGI